jgi:hypothetical protein
MLAKGLNRPAQEEYKIDLNNPLLVKLPGLLKQASTYQEFLCMGIIYIICISEERKCLRLNLTG